MAQEPQRARGQSIRAGLEHHDQIAFVRLGKVHPIRKQVQWRAERSHDGRDLARLAVNLVADDDRVVLPDHLAEVAGRRQVVMHAAVGDEKHVTARHFPIDHPGHVNAGLADDIAAELEHEPCARQLGRRTRRKRLEIRADRRQVERQLAGEVGDAEAAADVERLHRRARLGQVDGEIDGLALRFADGFRREALRARKDVEALELESADGRSPSAKPGTCSASMPNCLGPPPMRMPDLCNSKSGLTPTAIRGLVPKASAALLA